MDDKKLKIILGVLVLAVSSLALAKPKAEPTKVGGTYVVTSITRSEESFFVINFESETKTGKFDKLTLESDHLHFSVKEGQKTRISAEVLSENGSAAEVSQVLLYLPHAEGLTPVWLLSRKVDHDDLRATKYLEMHAPQSDFRIF